MFLLFSVSVSRSLVWALEVFMPFSVYYVTCNDSILARFFFYFTHVQHKDIHGGLPHSSLLLLLDVSYNSDLTNFFIVRSLWIILNNSHLNAYTFGVLVSNLTSRIWCLWNRQTYLILTWFTPVLVASAVAVTSSEDMLYTSAAFCSNMSLS